MGYDEINEIEDIVREILDKSKSLKIKKKCGKILSIINDLRNKEINND